MTPDAMASRVREAIGRTGLTDAAFANKIGLDKSKLSKSLAGVRRFTSLDLAKVAEAAGVTVDWLLGKDPVTPAMAARVTETATMSAGDAVAKARACASKYAQARSDLIFLGQSAATRVTVPFPRGGRKIDEGERLAAQALLRVPRFAAEPAASDLADVVEEHFGIDVAIIGLAQGCDGLAWHGPEAQLILAATSPTPTRQRFTLAHELGHLLAGDDQLLHVDTDVMDPDGRRQPSEMRANAFAAAFLMPEEPLRKTFAEQVGQPEYLDDQNFAHLVMKFAVSPSALAYRMSKLDLITRDQSAHFARLTTTRCALFANQVDRYVEWATKSASQRHPVTLISDMVSAYLDGKTTLRPVANLTGFTVDQLRGQLEPVVEAMGETEQEGPAFLP